MTHLLAVQHPSTSRHSTAKCPAPQPTRLRHDYRKRDFGVGYGNSSGYASDKQYARSWGELQFRFR